MRANLYTYVDSPYSYVFFILIFDVEIAQANHVIDVDKQVLPVVVSTCEGLSLDMSYKNQVQYLRLRFAGRILSFCLCDCCFVYFLVRFFVRLLSFLFVYSFIYNFINSKYVMLVFC